MADEDELLARLDGLADLALDTGHSRPLPGEVATAIRRLRNDLVAEQLKSGVAYNENARLLGSNDRLTADLAAARAERNAIAARHEKALVAGATLRAERDRLAAAAQDVLDEVDKILALDPPPIKFRAPYGTLARLRGELRALTTGDTPDAG